MIQIHDIDFKSRDKYNKVLLDFENLFKYPFGNDYFKINHGENYFKFFDLLGEPCFFIAKEDNKVLAICVAILKTVNLDPYEKVWYLCDLKVHPHYQGRFIVQKILNYAHLRCSKTSNKVYGISMNQATSYSNKFINYAQRLPYLNIKFQEILEFYLLDKHQKESNEFIKSNKNRFVSLTGIKDLILESSGKPLSFMHYVASSHHTVTLLEDEMKFMVCCPKNSKLSNIFKDLNIYPITTASILANFESNSWDLINSSEI
jgi:hypothetical protein